MIADLSGRGAVVTGAASGIGLAVASRLGQLGMRVVLADIDADGVARAADRLRADGVDAHAASVDVSRADSVDELAATAEAALGRVDLLVSNAGVVGMGTTWEIPLDEWSRVIGVNLWGLVHGIHAFVPRMLASGDDGHIVVMGSMTSVQTRPSSAPTPPPSTPPSASPTPSEPSWSSAGSGIGVTLVMPGMVRTGMNTEGAPASSVADAVVDGIRRDLPYVFTDPSRIPDVAARFDAIIEAARPTAPTHPVPTLPAPTHPVPTLPGRAPVPGPRHRPGTNVSPRSGAVDTPPDAGVSTLFMLRFDLRAPSTGAPAAELYQAALEIAAWSRVPGLHRRPPLRAPRVARRLPARRPMILAARDGRPHHDAADHASP